MVFVGPIFSRLRPSRFFLLELGRHGHDHGQDDPVHQGMAQHLQQNQHDDPPLPSADGRVGTEGTRRRAGFERRRDASGLGAVLVACVLASGGKSVPSTELVHGLGSVGCFVFEETAVR